MAVLAGAAWGAGVSRAAITATGDVGPGDPASWTSTTPSAGCYVGLSGAGSLTVDSGSILFSAGALIGWEQSASGTITVTGPGSTWNIGDPNSNNGFLLVGGVWSGQGGTLNVVSGGTVNLCTGGVNLYGSTSSINVDGAGSAFNVVGYVGSSIYVLGGTIGISNGGAVNVQGAVTLPLNGGSPTVFFGPNGGTLTTTSLYATPGALTGTGTVNTRGLVSDVDLVFDGTHGATQTLTFNSMPGQNVTVQLDLSGVAGPVGDLGVGYQASGSLVIRDGAKISSARGMLGDGDGSIGTATVDGNGSTWTTYGLSVGWSGSGTLDITRGGKVITGAGASLAFVGGSGTVNVDGPGSAWTVNGPLYLTTGFGNAALNISNGGVVNVSGATFVGGSSGTAKPTINFGPNGGTLTTTSLYAPFSSLTGTGNIYARGLVGDFDLIFDPAHGPDQTLRLTGANQAITIHLDMSGNGGLAGDLGIGYSGKASLIIRGGVQVTTGAGFVGYGIGSQGTAIVDGVGSVWTTGGYNFNVGWMGSGTVHIAHGGTLITNCLAEIGGFNGAGVATIDGPGSNWISAQGLKVFSGGSLKIMNGGSANSQGTYYGSVPSVSIEGTATVEGVGSVWNCGDVNLGHYDSGSGVLRISQGGTVTATSVEIGASSKLVMNVGDGSALNVGTGTFSNAGTVRLEAGVGVAGGAGYAPIMAGVWSNSGKIQALGGTWDGNSNTFTVSPVTAGVAGEAVGLDLSQGQRVLITDPVGGGRVGVSFMAAGSAREVRLTGSPLTVGQAGELQGVLGDGGLVVGGWTFAGSGINAGDPVYLSVEIGAGFLADNLSIWRWDGAEWGAYGAGDVTYDGDWVSFTVFADNGLGGYGVAVPEPGTVGVMGVGVLMMGWRRRGGARASRGGGSHGCAG